MSIGHNQTFSITNYLLPKTGIIFEMMHTQL